MSRLFFGGVLTIVGLLYLWLSYEIVQPSLQNGDWTGYLAGFLFLVAAVAAAAAGVNLVRAKRR